MVHWRAIKLPDLLPRARHDEQEPGIDAPARERKPFFGFRRAERSADEEIGIADSGQAPFYKRELRLPFGRGAGRETPIGRVPRSDGGRGRKKLVGLKIGASQIAAACIANDGSPELLRKAAARTIEAVTAAIGQLLELYTPQECANYFTNAGYAST